MNSFFAHLKRGVTTLAVLLCIQTTALAQATVTMPFSVGRQSCGSGTHRIHFYNYNATTNVLTNSATPAPCTPQLRIGATSFTFTSGLASVSFNPRDQNIYYFYTSYSPSLRTYVWKYPVGTCPTSTTPRLDTLRSFNYDILGVAFDKDGNGYMLDFTGTAPFTPIMRSIDFATGVIGPAKTMTLTGGAKIYAGATGDVAISPSGQMFFVVNNKMFTPDYQSYNTAATSITCTYIDTVRSPGGDLVGLTYAQGEVLAAYSGAGCLYREVQPLTGDTTVVTASAVQSTSDFASVISGIGVAKNLVSATPTGTANQYDVVYDIVVKNYGNYPLSGVQVTDVLTGTGLTAGNITNVTTAFVGATPPGLALNAAYNGKGNNALLSSTGQNLPAWPVAQSSFTIRISARFSGVISGQVYNNTASATATGFNGAALSDVSTNGTLPDLNGNDKPDDAGENVPTPLLISITPQTPPCASLSQTLYFQNFGTGANATTLPAPGTGTGATTGYTGSTTQPLPIDRFVLTANANSANTNHFISLTDHTNGSGRMMVVNADAANNVIYSGDLASVCAGQQYSLIFYAAFVGNSSYSTVCNGFGGFKYPKIRMRIKDPVSNLVITEISTTEITSTSWTQYGMKWVMPAGYASVRFELVNDGLGGCGNDLAIDDIALGTCDPQPTVAISGSTSGCIGGSTTLSANLNDANVLPGTKEYQWQISNDGTTWSNIALATAATYNIPALAASDLTRYYRVIVAAQGNMASVNCRYTSPSFQITAKTASTAPTGATASVNNTCPGESVTLAVQGGALGTNAVWRWYSASCGGTLVGTGASISVTPSATTTYYVRAEGDCNSTTCVSVTVTIACDIDDDNDGIPDTVEGTGDSDGDGVNNSLDLDSDNDGIPDVVEAGGVDANGDGRIDNYTDTDGDGFSQNVDGNNSGHNNSGNGLGLPDLDGDGVPNYIDLDSDNDGIPDVVEVYGTDANNDGRIDNYTDTDNDGFSNNVDGDVGNDGTAENSANALLRTGADTNNNGRPETYPFKNQEVDSKANPYDPDSDWDGILDVVEAGFADANRDGRIDGPIGANGWSTTVSALASLNLPNRDGTGRPNVYDVDSDDDGICDNVEAISTSSFMLPVSVDSDDDGIDNSYDGIVGFGGLGLLPVNTDGDAFPDYLDFDTDGDGTIDRVEGNDFNSNTQPDDDVALTGLDTDGDGLDNKFDNDNTSSKGGSRYMGNGGSTNGPITAGSRTMVQRSYPTLSDRDWRMVNFVLSFKFISVKATLRDESSAQLSWTAVYDKPVAYFMVERSLDGQHFTSVQQVAAQAALQVETRYEVADNLAGISAGRIYYRVKAVDAEGRSTLSAVVTVARTESRIPALSVAPNPARSVLQISLHSPKAVTARFHISDAAGRSVLQFTESLDRGHNSFSNHRIAALPAGMYYLCVLVDGKVQSVKFEVQR